MKILVLNGPNLNLTGLREPEVYGTRTLDDLMGELAEAGKSGGHELYFFQSNHEGALVDKLHEALLRQHFPRLFAEYDYPATGDADEALTHFHDGNSQFGLPYPRH